MDANSTSSRTRTSLSTSTTTTSTSTTTSFAVVKTDVRRSLTSYDIIDTATTGSSSSSSSSQIDASNDDFASLHVGDAVGIAIGSFIFGVLLTIVGFAVYLYRQRHKSQKRDNRADSAAVQTVHQVSEIQNGNHQQIVYQLSPVVADRRHGLTSAGLEPVRHEARSNEHAYCDMTGVQAKKKRTRPPPAGNSTALSSSEAQNVTGSSSSGLYANLRRLSARLSRGKWRTPRPAANVYENVANTGIYYNV